MLCNYVCLYHNGLNGVWNKDKKHCDCEFLLWPLKVKLIKLVYSVSVQNTNTLILMRCTCKDSS